MSRKKKEKEKTLKREQIRLLLHYEWLQGTAESDASKKINNAYGANTVSRGTVYNWYDRFEKEGMQLKDKKHTGRPQEIDREAVIRVIEANPTMTTRMLADDFDCHHSTIEEILHEAGKFWSLDFYLPFRFEVAKDSFGSLSIDGRAKAEESWRGYGVARTPKRNAIFARCDYDGRDLAAIQQSKSAQGMASTESARSRNTEAGFSSA